MVKIKVPKYMSRKTVALNAVKKASEFLKKQFRVINVGVKKPDGSLVSAADRESERIIVSIIKKAFPNDGILSEESPERQGETGYRWIIDPLDGTHNFLNGFPVFGCLLALEYKKEIILSICSFPVLNELFVTEKNKGARLNNKRIHVSKSSVIKGQFFFSDGNIRRNKKIIGDIKKLIKAGLRIRIVGSSAFGMTRVAMGQAAIATNRVATLWDIAAPALLVTEAGGKIINVSSREVIACSKSIIGSMI